MKKNFGLGSLSVLLLGSFMFLFCLSLMLCFPGPASASPMDEAKTAYKAKNYAKARSLLEPIARDGNRKAMYVLGTMLRKGLGGEKDIDQSMMWLFKSAERNFDPAMMLLGKLEIGTDKKDWQQGCMWFRRAAELGNKEGMVFTGTCYLTGDGTPQTPEDHVESLAWFIAAERTGAEDAKGFRKDLEKIVSPEQILVARERSKVLGKISRPKKPLKIASKGPKPKQPLPKPASSPAPAKPKPVITMPAKPVAPAVAPIQKPLPTKLTKKTLSKASGAPGLKKQHPKPSTVSAAPVDKPLLSRVVVAKGYNGEVFIDEKGREIVGPGVRFRSQKFINGYIIGFKDGKDRLYNRTGAMISGNFKPKSGFSDGLALVKMSIGSNFITENGDIAFEKSFQNAKPFGEGLAPVKTTRKKGQIPKWGYIDTTGSIVIEPEYEDAWSFKNGRAFVKNKTGRKAMIDTSGNRLTDFKFVDFSAPKNNLIKVDLSPPTGGSTLLSMAGVKILGTPFNSINPRYGINSHFSGWSVRNNNGATGLLDTSGMQIIAPGQVKTIGRMGEKFITVQKDEKGLYGYMDYRGSWTIEPLYYRANPFSQGRAFVQLKPKGPVHLIDTSGRVIKKYPNLNILVFFGEFMEGKAAVVDVNNGYRLGYLDRSGEWAIKPVFNGDAVSGKPNRSGFRFGLAPACTTDKPKKCGFIDDSGAWKIKPRFLVLPKHFH